MRDRRQDDGERFSSYYREHHGHVLAYAQRRCPDAELASQVTAETFTVAWRRLEDALTGGRPWLFRTASLSVANVLRTERRQARTAARTARQPGVSDRTAGTPDTVVGLHVRGVLSGLAEHDREVLMLAYWEDLATADLARVLGCATGTAAVRLHRARGRFRAALAAAETDTGLDAAHRSHADEESPR